MASLDGKNHHIELKSKVLKVTGFVLKENGKPFKITSNNSWKNVAPDDLIVLNFVFETGFLGYSNFYKPKMNVTIYRNNEVLFTEDAYFTAISSMISHFELEEVNINK